MKSVIYKKHLETPFEKFIKSDEFRNGRRVNLLLGVTGQGKSMFQDKDIRRIVANEGFKVVIRVSPDLAIRDDGVLVSETLGWSNITHHDGSSSSTKPVGTYRENSVDTLRQFLDMVSGCVSMSLTWQTFSNFCDDLRNTLVKRSLIKKTLIVIEEAHQMIGVGCSKEDGESGFYDSNNNPIYKSTKVFQEVFGCPTPRFDGTHWNSLTTFRKAGAKTVALSATITRHQRGELTTYDEFNDRFYVINELPSLEEILPHQAWWRSFNSFPLENDRNGNEVCQTAMDELFKNEDRREERVRKIKEYKDKYNISDIDSKIAHVIFTGNDAQDRPDWQSANSVRFRRIFEPFAVKKIADGCDPTLGWNVVLNAQRRVCLDFNGNVVRVFNNDKEAFDAIEDPNDPATFLWLKNKGRSGIDIHNIGTETILRCRTSTEIRTEIPIQVFGRGVRINTGLGKSFFRNNCNYDVRKFMKLAPKHYNIPSRDVAEILLLANCVDYTYPTSNWTLDVWGEAETQFKAEYMNSLEDGRELIESLITDDVCLCPTCNQPLPKNFVLPTSSVTCSSRLALN